MATPPGGSAELPLSKAQREQLGKDFMSWIERVEDSRRDRMKDTWIKAMDNWEGKAPVKTFPWPGASNVHLPITGTNTNAIKARIVEAANAQDPIYSVRPSAGGFFLNTGDAQISYELFARWWQNISKWIEKSKEINHKPMMLENAGVCTTYGDSWLVSEWEKTETMDASFNADTGEVDLLPRTLFEGARVQVAHPKDIYIEFDAKDAQQASKVGLGFDLDLPTLRQWRDKGTYDKEVSEELEKTLSAKQETDRMAEELGISEHKEWGPERDEFEQVRRNKAGISDDGGPNALRMVRVWARADLDGDGIPEEVIFEVEKTTGRVPYARYADYWSRQKPVVQFSYDNRPGSIMNRGVPELLFNLQTIMDTTIRDHLDNNKIKNTKMFLAKKGSPVEEDARVYPSRVMFVNNTSTRDGDLVPIDLGSAGSVTQIADIGILEKYAQFIVGLTDQNLGFEKRSRTPATTTLALIEEGNKGLVEKIDQWRSSQQQWWKQILMLYLQHGDPEVLVKVAVTTSGGPESTEEVLAGVTPEEEKRLFLLAWPLIDKEEFFNQISVNAEVNTNALNRGVQRQESLALFAQFDQFVLKMIELANLIGGSIADPNMRTMLLFFVKGYRRAMAKVLDTMDIKDQEVFIPQQLEDFIEQVNSVPADGAPQGGSGQPQPSPAGQAQNLASQPPGVTNNGESPGRPVAGGSRSAGELVSVDGGGGGVN